MTTPPQFFNTPEHEPFTLGGGNVGALLIHGFPGTPAEMRPLGERLAASGVAASGFLLPGLGKDIANLSSMNRAKWIGAMRDRWMQVQNAHERAVLVGFSMGGAIAAHLAAELPPDALILLAPFWKSRNWLLKVVPVAKYIFRTVAPFERADFADPQFRSGLEKMMPEADLDDPATQAFLREQVKIKSDVVHEILKLGRNVQNVAQQISAPTLIVQGREDEVVETAVTRQLLSRFAGPISYHEIVGTHTFPKLEQPSDGLFVELVLNFLAQQQLIAPTQEATP